MVIVSRHLQSRRIYFITRWLKFVFVVRLKSIHEGNLTQTEARTDCILLFYGGKICTHSSIEKSRSLCLWHVSLNMFEFPRIFLNWEQCPQKKALHAFQKHDDEYRVILLTVALSLTRHHMADCSQARRVFIISTIAKTALVWKVKKFQVTFKKHTVRKCSSGIQEAHRKNFFKFLLSKSPLL